MPARIRVWFFNIYLRRYCPKYLLAFAASALLLPAKSAIFIACKCSAALPSCIFRFIQTFNQVFRKHFPSRHFPGPGRDSRNRPGWCNRKVPTVLSRGSFPRRTDVVLLPPDQNRFHAEQQTIIHTDDENTGKFQLLRHEASSTVSVNFFFSGTIFFALSHCNPLYLLDILLSNLHTLLFFCTHSCYYILRLLVL